MIYNVAIDWFLAGQDVIRLSYFSIRTNAHRSSSLHIFFMVLLRGRAVTIFSSFSKSQHTLSWTVKIPGICRHLCPTKTETLAKFQVSVSIIPGGIWKSWITPKTADPLSYQPFLLTPKWSYCSNSWFIIP